MKRMLRFGLVAAALFIAGGFALSVIRACAPEGPSLVFTWERHPDLPLNAYASGRLGILQPSYARSYLVVAYRYMMGTPLNEAEQQSALALWGHRLQGGVALEGVGGDGSDQAESRTWGGESAGEKAWLEARRAYRKEAPALPESMVREGYEFIESISPDAYDVAIRHLQDRARRFDRVHLEAWIQAQDQVFSCTPKQAQIPAAADDSGSPLFRMDRAYQIAAAHFYSGHFDEARTAFRAIAEDEASPYRRLAAYLVGRCWIRQAELEKDPVIARPFFVQAHAQFQTLCERGLPSKPTCEVAEPMVEAALKEVVRDVEERTFIRIDPAMAAHRLTQRLLSQGPLSQERANAFGTTLARYSDLLDGQIRGEVDDPKKTPRQIPEALLKDDLTDWAFHFRDTGPVAFQFAQARWRERKSIPWLLMALSNAEPADTFVDELLEAAARVPVTHPAHESLGFHRARLLKAMGRRDEARHLADSFLERASVPSAINLWRALRLPMAQNLDATLSDLLREPVGIRGVTEGPTCTGPTSANIAGVQSTHPEVMKLMKSVSSPRFLEGDGAVMLNSQVPTELLIRFAHSPKTPPHLRREWIRAGWTRSVLLDRWDLALQLTPELMALEPEMKPSLAAFQGASASDRPQASLLVLLRHPGLNWMVFQGLTHRNFVLPGERPLSLRHRDTYLARCWWTSVRSDPDWEFGSPDPSKLLRMDEWSWPSCFYYPLPNLAGEPLWRLNPNPEGPAWLSVEQKACAESERKRLLALEDGPTWLCRQTLAWARSAPEDPRLPEALHLAVRASRIYPTGPLSKQCFQLLHKRHAGSPWAKKTPYHY